MAQIRIFVEHGIRRIKGWRILRDEYRLALGLFATVAQAVVSLVQLGRLRGQTLPRPEKTSTILVPRNI